MTRTVKDFLDDISSLEVVSLAYDDPRIKLQLIFQLLLQQFAQKQSVLYFDFDTQFSGLLHNLPKQDLLDFIPEYLRVMSPSQPLEILDLIPNLKRENTELVVIDTLNTMQQLFLRTPFRADAKTASHRSAIMISLLEESCRTLSKKTMLILNLTRSRPTEVQDGLTWQRGIVGGRVSRFKSDLIVSAKETHPGPNKAARAISLKVEEIYSDRFRSSQDEFYDIPTDDDLLTNRP